jgi:hypothetical protein
MHTADIAADSVARTQTLPDGASFSIPGCVTFDLARYFACRAA